MQKIAFLVVFLATLFTSSLSWAQCSLPKSDPNVVDDQADVRFSLESFDCINGIMYINVDVKNPTNRDFQMAGVNYRWNFLDSLAIDSVWLHEQVFALNGGGARVIFDNGAWTYGFFSLAGSDFVIANNEWHTTGVLACRVADFDRCAEFDWREEGVDNTPKTVMTAFCSASDQRQVDIVDHENYSRCLQDDCNFPPDARLADDVNDESDNFSVAVPVQESVVLCFTTIDSIADRLTNNTIQYPFIDGNDGAISNLTPLNDTCFRYESTVAAPGSDVLVFAICDERDLCDTITVNISIGVNNAPIAEDDTVDVFNTESVTISPTDNDNDPELGNLQVAEIIPQTTNGTFQIVGPDSTDVIYTPAVNTVGEETALVVICDNGIPKLCDTSLLVINVLAAPDTIDIQFGELFADCVNDTLFVPIFVRNETDTTLRLGVGNFRFLFNDNALGNPSLKSLDLGSGDASVQFTNGTWSLDITYANGVPPTLNANSDFILLATLALPITDKGQCVDLEWRNCALGHNPCTVANEFENISSYPTLIIDEHINSNECLDDVCNVTPDALDPNDANNFSDTIYVDLDNRFDSTLCIPTVKVPGDFYTNDEIRTPLLDDAQLGLGFATVDDTCVTYSPIADQEGEDVVRFRICDEGNLCDTVTIIFNVFERRDTINAVDDFLTIGEDDPVTIDPTANDDIRLGAGGTFEVVIVEGPDSGTVSVDSNGNVTYDPDPNFNGNDTICYAIVSDLGVSDTAKIFISIELTNEAPMAIDDNVQTTIGMPIQGSVGANDQDPDGDDLSFKLIPGTGVFNGTILFDTATGEYFYDPNDPYIGEDSVTYEVCDPFGLCDTATLYITIIDTFSNQNDAPIALNDVYVGEEGALTTGDVTDNDFDPDGDRLVVTTTPITESGNGDLILDSTGVFRYFAEPGDTTEFTFTYEICDRGIPVKCDTATVTIDLQEDDPLNSAPVGGDDALNTPEDSTTCINVLDNDSDIEGDNLSVDTTQTEGPFVPGATFTLSEDGELCYTPAPGYTGPDQIVYTVCDDGVPAECTEATVSITVVPRQEPNLPPVAEDDELLVTKDEPTDGNVLTNDFDPNGDPIKVDTAATQGPENGTLELNEDGTFTYTPDPGFAGADSFTYTVCDVNLDCSEATVYIEVSDPAGNQSPIAFDDEFDMLDGELLEANVTGNDAHPGGDSVVVALLDGIDDPAAGILLDLDAEGNFRFISNQDYEGTTTFTYTLCEVADPTDCDTATVTINIDSFTNAEPNLRPQANDDNNATLIGVPVDGNVLSNDIDPNRNNLTLDTALVDQPDNGTVTIDENGDYTYTPNNGFTGTDQFVYRVCDDGVPVLCDTATVTILVSPDPDNTTPIAVDDQVPTNVDQPVSGNILSNDFDPDGDPLKVDTAQTVGPENGTLILNEDGTFTYTPDPGFIGEDSFTYVVCDPAGNCDQATVYFEVIDPTGNANDRPVAQNDNAIIFVDSVLEDYNVLGNDFDADGNNIFLEEVFNGTFNGTVTFDSTGEITYTPNAGFVGNDSFQYVVCDDGIPPFCDTATMFIEVIPRDTVNENFAPIANNDANTTDIETPVSGNVLSNDFDPDGDNLVLDTIPVTDPQNGVVTLNEDGTYTYIPDPGFVGTDFFTYSVCDDHVPPACTEAIVYIVVEDKADNQAPIAEDDYRLNTPNDTLVSNFATNDTDPENQGLTAVTIPVENPRNGSVVIEEDGTFTYVPNTDFVGLDTFAYAICDNGTPVLCDTALVIINMIAITPCEGDTCEDNNEKPVAVVDFFTTFEDSTLNSNVLGNDYDPDSTKDNLNVIVGLIVGPSNGTLVIDSAGNFSYLNDPGFTGLDSFQYVICDMGTPVLCDTTFAYITVLPDSINVGPEANDAPIARDNNYVVPENGSVTDNILNNDNDPNGDSIIINTTPLSGPSNGTVTINPDGTFTYVADSGFIGNDEFVYEICDDAEPVPACDTATVSIVVVGDRNIRPLGEDDVLHVATDSSLPIVDILLGNDSDPNKDSIAIAEFLNGPFNGTIDTLPDGTIVYTPDPGFEGVDSFQYIICDNRFPVLCDTVDVIVYVEEAIVFDAVNDTINLPVGGGTFDPRDNDLLPEGVNDTIFIGTDPLNGTATVNEDGTITYVPNDGFIGQDSFTYIICIELNGKDTCDTAWVYINIDGVCEIPEGFSPNNDGMNDVFDLGACTALFPEMEVTIYNRYGDEVWSSNGAYQNDWDGTFILNDNPLPAGTYFYVAKLNDGTDDRKVGFVVIAR